MYSTYFMIVDWGSFEVLKKRMNVNKKKKKAAKNLFSWKTNKHVTMKFCEPFSIVPLLVSAQYLNCCWENQKHHFEGPCSTLNNSIFTLPLVLQTSTMSRKLSFIGSEHYLFAKFSHRLLNISVPSWKWIEISTRIPWHGNNVFFFFFSLMKKGERRRTEIRIG